MKHALVLIREDGYYLNNNQCLQCDSNCKKCSNSASHCLTCENGYYLSPSNSCERCVQYCEECDTNNDNKCA